MPFAAALRTGRRCKMKRMGAVIRTGRARHAVPLRRRVGVTSEGTSAGGTPALPGRNGPRVRRTTVAGRRVRRLDRGERHVPYIRVWGWVSRDAKGARGEQASPSSAGAGS